ncbi:MAG: hypothetical protein JSU87_09790 [Gemmatimonadota bacterium]|nr:MAG: hypothetical protein JSU87_09790 [Gemmatimonadota bacterium]
MSSRLSLYAPLLGAPGALASSGSAVFVRAVTAILRNSGLELRTRWLRADEGPRSDGHETTTLGHALYDSARYLLFVYPLIPLPGSAGTRVSPPLAKTIFRALRMKARLTRQRILVLVHELPIEMQEGKALAGEPTPGFDTAGMRATEAALLGAAHRLALPAAFATPIQERHGVEPHRIFTFHRHPYLETADPRNPPTQFDRGAVNFLYSGAVDSSVASNFREILKAIRNAPATRLHVCGPGREAVEGWLDELDVPNVRHYGHLDADSHDWLARRCDVGLILHPSDNSYNHLRPTLKYSAYLANGLAVLSTDLKAVAANIRADGVGLAMPIRELAVELMRWATRPALWSEKKGKATEHGTVLRSGGEVRSWIERFTKPS